MPAHPRSRGENVISARAITRGGGSSPLTRGKRQHHHQSPRDRGLIPAHAGKTRKLVVIPEAHLAHPRSRGENGGEDRGASGTAGSSPLTRGKPSGSIVARRSQGLIPAHAGKTQAMAWAQARAEAHPRSRGENTS